MIKINMSRCSVIASGAISSVLHQIQIHIVLQLLIHVLFLFL